MQDASHRALIIAQGICGWQTVILFHACDRAGPSRTAFCAAAVVEPRSRTASAAPIASLRHHESV